jgi:hypothetical protein
MDGRRETASDSDTRPYNNLLRRLNAADYALIAPHLSREVSIAN